MPEVNEEIVDIDSLASKASEIDFNELVAHIIEREFVAGAIQDNVGVLYVKKEALTPDFQTKVMSQVDVWTGRKDELQEMYEKAARQTNQTVRFNLTELADQEIRSTVEVILSNVQVRPAPADMPDNYRLFSYKEISGIARDNMIAAFQQKTNLAKFLYEQGVSSDYRPSQEQVELAILTAYFLKALQDDPASQLIRPSTSLFTP